jgi:hypothetical protein
MDGVDAADIGPGALDLCTVLEHLLGCHHGGCNGTKQTSAGGEPGDGRDQVGMPARSMQAVGGEL